MEYMYQPTAKMKKRQLTAHNTPGANGNGDFRSRRRGVVNSTTGQSCPRKNSVHFGMGRRVAAGRTAVGDFCSIGRGRGMYIGRRVGVSADSSLGRIPRPRSNGLADRRNASLMTSRPTGNHQLPTPSANFVSASQFRTTPGVNNFNEGTLSEASSGCNVDNPGVSEAKATTGLSHQPDSSDASVFSLSESPNTIRIVSQSDGAVASSVNGATTGLSHQSDSSATSMFSLNESTNTIRIVSQSDEAVASSVNGATAGLSHQPDSSATSMFSLSESPNTIRIVSESDEAVASSVNGATTGLSHQSDSSATSMFSLNESTNTIRIVSQSNEAVASSVNGATAGLSHQPDSSATSIFSLSESPNTIRIVSQSDEAVASSVNGATSGFTHQPDSSATSMFSLSESPNTIRIVSQSDEAVASSVNGATSGFTHQPDSSATSMFSLSESPNTIRIVSQSDEAVVSSLDGETNISRSQETTVSGLNLTRSAENTADGSNLSRSGTTCPAPHFRISESNTALGPTLSRSSANTGPGPNLHRSAVSSSTAAGQNLHRYAVTTSFISNVRRTATSPNLNSRTPRPVSARLLPDRPVLSSVRPQSPVTQPMPHAAPRLPAVPTSGTCRQGPSGRLSPANVRRTATSPNLDSRIPHPVSARLLSDQPVVLSSVRPQSPVTQPMPHAAPRLPAVPTSGRQGPSGRLSPANVRRTATSPNLNSRIPRPVSAGLLPDRPVLSSVRPQSPVTQPMPHAAPRLPAVPTSGRQGPSGRLSPATENATSVSGVRFPHHRNVSGAFRGIQMHSNNQQSSGQSIIRPSSAGLRHVPSSGLHSDAFPLSEHSSVESMNYSGAVYESPSEDFSSTLPLSSIPYPSQFSAEPAVEVSVEPQTLDQPFSERHPPASPLTTNQTAATVEPAGQNLAASSQVSSSPAPGLPSNLVSLRVRLDWLLPPRLLEDFIFLELANFNALVTNHLEELINIYTARRRENANDDVVRTLTRLLHHVMEINGGAGHAEQASRPGVVGEQETWAQRAQSWILDIHGRMNVVGRRGMSEDEIAEIPTREYRQSVGEEECMICLAVFENQDWLRTLQCQHEFHMNCVDKWLKLNATCPMCRHSVTKS